MENKEHVIKYSLRNCKKIENMDIELTNDSWVYLVKGQNDLGKSTIGQAIVTMMKLENKIPDIVTHGKKVTTLEAEVPGPLGRYYTKMTATQDNTTFTMYDPTGAKITRVKDMRNVFQYNATTVEDFVKNSYTAKGRREQIQVLASLLDPIDEARFNKMTTDIDTKTGSLYIARKNAKEVMDRNKSILDSYSCTDEDKEFYSENSQAEIYLKGLEERLAIAHQMPSKENELEMITSNYETSKTSLETYKTSLENRLSDNEDRINRLKMEIATIEDSNIELSKEIITESNKILKLNEDYRTNITATESREDVGEDPIELQQEIEITRGILSRVNILKNDLDNYSKFDAIYKDTVETYNKAEKELSDVRAEQKELIKKIKIPGINLEIKDDTIYVDGFALNEYQLADSKIILVVAAILAKVNHKSPILVIGKLRELDSSNLAKLEQIAKDNNCIIIGDYVEDDIQNIVVEGFIPEEGIDALPVQKIAPTTTKQSTNINEI